MKLYKLFFIAAIALGFMACNADDQPEVPQLEQETDTYASITVKFPGTVGTRAVPGDYNADGEWKGRDALRSVTVFLVNMDRAEVIHDQFTASHFTGIEDGYLQPSLAIKATAGDSIRAFVVINGDDGVAGGILETLKNVTAADFETEFAKAYNKIASDVASYDATTNKETIMMTNDMNGYSTRLLPGITAEAAKTGPDNHINIQVERVVSRAFMTVVKNPETGWPVYAVIGGNPETEIARVTNVTYAVGQSNKNFYLMKQSDYAVPAPVYGFKPTTFTEWDGSKTVNFDYEGLADNNFTSITQWIGETKTIIDYLREEATSKFVLPVNHLVELEADEVGARDAYRKGNTTFFEIRATFTPNVLYDAEITYNELEEVESIGALTTVQDPSTADTVFWGENDKKFYTSRVLAESFGQQATEFPGRVMKYVLWLNPNSYDTSVENPNPKISPTVRNQIYHAHIDAFLRMGLPNNPLNPNDQDNPLNPDNPINPEDLLKTDYTYLSVSVQVLPWTIHSYTYDLKDPGTMY